MRENLKIKHEIRRVRCQMPGCQSVTFSLTKRKRALKQMRKSLFDIFNGK